MSNQKYTQADIPILYNDICYYLAHFTHLHIRNKKLVELSKNVDSYKHIVVCIMRAVQKSARNKRDEKNKKYSENETRSFVENLPTSEIVNIASQSESARQMVEDYILPFRNFELVVTPYYAYHPNQCSPFDSVADVDLFQKYNTSFREVLSKKSALGQIYRPMESHLPLEESNTLKTNPQQFTVDMLYSQQVPQKEQYHKIWITPHLYIQTKFKTTKSLSEYMQDNPLVERSLMQLIYHTRQFLKTMDKSLPIEKQQEYITKQFHQLQVETAVRDHRRFAQIYALLAVEKLNDLLHLTQNNTSDVKHLIDLRDTLAHPAEFNFDPKVEFEKFREDVVKKLASVLGKTKKDINADIGVQPIEHQKDNMELILLLDEQRILRETLIHILNLNGNNVKGSLFVKQKLITKAESKVLQTAWDERKQLCHEDIIPVTTDMNEYLRILNKIYVGIYKQVQLISQQQNGTANQPPQQQQSGGNVSQSTMQQNITVSGQGGQGGGLVQTTLGSNGNPSYLHPQIMNDVNQTVGSGNTDSDNDLLNFPFIKILAEQTGTISNEDFNSLFSQTIHDKTNTVMIGAHNKFVQTLYSVALAKESIEQKNYQQDKAIKQLSPTENIPTNSIEFSFDSKKDIKINQNILNFYFKSNQQNGDKK